jgi:hypothetical protein
MKYRKKSFLCLLTLAAMALLLLLPSSGNAEVVVLDLTFPPSPNPEVRFFIEAMRSWLSYRKAELGGERKVYALTVVEKKHQVEIYLDGERKPRWVVFRSELTRCAYPRAIVFPSTLCGHETAKKIYECVLLLEKERAGNF